MTDQSSRPAQLRQRVLAQGGSCPVREQPQRLTLAGRCGLPGIVRMRSRRWGASMPPGSTPPGSSPTPTKRGGVDLAVAANTPAPAAPAPGDHVRRRSRTSSRPRGRLGTGRRPVGRACRGGGAAVEYTVAQTGLRHPWDQITTAYQA
ncbi:hypothetical protein ACFCYH_18255 [Streptomyces sp. NPDC056400]|uniref:hypothetical protein n=1 Tax=Streptomyces sp. NPDC056400 TaxID=3345808 RepID=UPI0035D8E51D